MFYSNQTIGFDTAETEPSTIWHAKLPKSSKFDQSWQVTIARQDAELDAYGAYYGPGQPGLSERLGRGQS